MVEIRPTGIDSPFDPHSRFAASIARLFDWTLVACAVIAGVVTIALAYSLYASRARRAEGEPPQVTGHLAIEVIWTVVPIAVVAWLFVLAVDTMGTADPPPDRAPDLTVIAHQWWWELRYASGVVTANEVHLPVGRPLLLRIESADVVHDFSVPQLTRKIDAVPGHPNYVWLEADTPGTYGGACFEFCGAQHAWMRLAVIADEADAYAAWERGQLAPAAPPAGDAAHRGETLFQSQACGTCHAIAGRGFSGGIAPDLTHLASRTTLGAGVVDNSPDELRSWLRDPQSIKPGSHMPSFKLNGANVGDLAAYLEGMR